MKKLIAAVAAMLAATLFSGSALAVTGSQAKALHATASAAVKAGYCRHRHHGCYHRACGGCAGRLYTYTTRYTTCGTCGGGACWGGCGPYYPSYYGPQCGCAGCGAGCGYYGGGWSLFGWLF